RHANKRLIAYVVRNHKYNLIAHSKPDSEPSPPQVTHWQMVFDQIYDSPAPPSDPKFNIRGWNSSYTGQPIADEEMREWLDDTVGRVLSFEPKCVLEIGCGTGMILARVGPFCSRYWATDFSQQALAGLDDLFRSNPDLSHVTLLHRTAENFEAVEPESFDTIVLNSVVQYFPSINYLVDVLEQAVRSVKSG